MARSDNSMIGVAKYERVENDFYPSPPDTVEAIYKYLNDEYLIGKHTMVIEPACGDGAISKVFEAKGHRVISSDLYPQLEGAETKDFINDPFIIDHHGTLVITNPPYANPYIDQFIERVIDMVKNDGCVGALLMRNEVDCAQSRRPYFEECQFFHSKLVLNWRPRWIAGSTGSPRHNYSWYIWSTSNRMSPANIRYTLKVK